MAAFDPFLPLAKRPFTAFTDISCAHLGVRERLRERRVSAHGSTHVT